LSLSLIGEQFEVWHAIRSVVLYDAEASLIHTVVPRVKKDMIVTNKRNTCIRKEVCKAKVGLGHYIYGPHTCTMSNVLKLYLYTLPKTKGRSDCIVFYQGFWIPIRWYFFFGYALVWLVLHGNVAHKNCAGNSIIIRDIWYCKNSAFCIEGNDS